MGTVNRCSAQATPGPRAQRHEACHVFGRRLAAMTLSLRRHEGLHELGPRVGAKLQQAPPLHDSPPFKDRDVAVQ